MSSPTESATEGHATVTGAGDPQQYWLHLDLRSLERCQRTEPLSPSNSWRTVALAACGRMSVLRCRQALNSLAECEDEEVFAGRSATEWKLLGQRVLAEGLSRAGATELAPSSSASAVRLTQDVLAEVMVAQQPLVALRALLFDSADPLLWNGAAPVLARLAVGAEDKDCLTELYAKVNAEFSAAPWFPFVERQQALACWKLGLPVDGRLAELLDELLPSRESAQWFGHAGAADVQTPASFPEGEGDAALLALGGERKAQVIRSLAGLRIALDPDEERSALCRLTPEVLKQALSQRIRVVVHEERPEYPGFSLLRALAMPQRVVLVDLLEHAGSELRTWDEQSERMALYGASALLLAEGDSDEVADWLAEQHDEGLELLGISEPDVQDPQAGRARLEQLTRQAAEACPDIPRAWQLHGGALIQQLVAGELEQGNEDGPVERWYAGARIRFERAEWAHQVYAQALEEWDQHEEAAIAWCDAWALDPQDPRNLIGMARGRLREGLTEAAIGPTDDALAARPEATDAWRLRAELALRTGDDDTAQFASEVALQVSPEHPETRRIAASCAERSGDLGQALEHLDQAVDAGDERCLTRAALVAARLGDFDGAQERTLAAMREFPSNPASYIRASTCYRRLGEVDDAVGVLEYGLSRSGPRADIIEAYANAVAELLDTEDCAAKVEEFVGDWEEHERVVLTFGSALAHAGRLDQAIVAFDHMLEQDPDSLNAKWRKVQSCMQYDGQAEAKRLLPDLLQSPLAYPYALWAELVVDEDPDGAWEALANADAESEPAFVWVTAHFLAEARGDSATVDGLKQRLLSIPARALNQVAQYAVDMGAPWLGEHCVTLLKQHEDTAATKETILSVSAKLLERKGEVALAAEQLQLLHQEVPGSVVTPEELRCCLNGGHAEAVAALAEKRLQFILNEGPEGAGDGYLERAYAAAAGGLRGDFGPLTSLLEQASPHPEVVACALRATANRNPELAQRCRETLSKAAPGLLHCLEREIANLSAANSEESQ